MACPKSSPAQCRAPSNSTPNGRIVEYVWTAKWTARVREKENSERVQEAVLGTRWSGKSFITSSFSSATANQDQKRRASATSPRRRRPQDNCWKAHVPDSQPWLRRMRCPRSRSCSSGPRAPGSLPVSRESRRLSFVVSGRLTGHGRDFVVRLQGPPAVADKRPSRHSTHQILR